MYGRIDTGGTSFDTILIMKLVGQGESIEDLVEML